MHKSEIRVVVVPVRKVARVVAIKNTLEMLQEIVGGPLEMMPPLSGLSPFHVYADEDGKIHDKEINYLIFGDAVVGTVVISKCDEKGEEVGLGVKQAEFAAKFIDQFRRTQGAVLA